MELLSILRTLGGLGVVLGILGGALWLVRRYDLRLPGRVMTTRDRRLELIETLPIDARRMVALVRRDGREHLVLIAPEGHVILESAIVRDAADIAAEEARRAAKVDAILLRDDHRHRLDTGDEPVTSSGPQRFADLVDRARTVEPAGKAPAGRNAAIVARLATLSRMAAPAMRAAMASASTAFARVERAGARAMAKSAETLTTAAQALARARSRTATSVAARKTANAASAAIKRASAAAKASARAAAIAQDAAAAAIVAAAAAGPRDPVPMALPLAETLPNAAPHPVATPAMRTLPRAHPPRDAVHPGTKRQRTRRRRRAPREKQSA